MAASRSGASSSFGYSQSTNSKRVRNLKPLVSSEVLQPDSTSVDISNRDLDSLMNNGSRKDEQPLLKARVDQKNALGLPKLHIFSDMPRSTKKRCRVCKRSDVMLGSSCNIAREDAVSCQVDGIGKGSLEIKGVKPVNDDELQEQGRISKSSMVGSDACSSNSLGSAEIVIVACEDSHGQIDEKLMETTYGFTVEVANVIKRIESGNLALQLFAEKLDATSSVREAFVRIGPNLVNASKQLNEGGAVSRQKVRYHSGNSERTHEFEQTPMFMATESIRDPLQSQSQPQKANDIWEKIWTSSQEAASRKNQNVAYLEGQYIRGLRLPPHPAEVAKQSFLAAAKSYRDSRIHESLAGGDIVKRTKSQARPLMLSQSMGSKALNVRRNKACKSMSRNETASRRHVPPSDFEESDKMARSSSSPSYMSTTQWETPTSPSNNCGDGGYTLPSSKSSRIADSSRGSTSTGHDSSSTSSSGSSRSYLKERASPPKCGDARTKTRRSSPEKRTGQLRRLKNKLGLIFHHHHHHHHHYHAGSDDNDAAKRIGHQKESMWEHLQQVFGHRGKGDFQGKQAAERLNKRKSVVRKNQVGHCHSLVEGLMRHLRQSKKSKPSKAKKGGIQQRTGNVEHHGQDDRWWKMLQNRGGVKLRSRGRVKLGFGGNKKKSQLKQLKR